MTSDILRSIGNLIIEYGDFRVLSAVMADRGDKEGAKLPYKAALANMAEIHELLRATPAPQSAQDGEAVAWMVEFAPHELAPLDEVYAQRHSANKRAAEFEPNEARVAPLYPASTVEALRAELAREIEHSGEMAKRGVRLADELAASQQRVRELEAYAAALSKAATQPATGNVAFDTQVNMGIAAPVQAVSAERVSELESLIADVVAADDAAVAEMRDLGLEPPAETVALTERLRAAIAKQEKGGGS